MPFPIGSIVGALSPEAWSIAAFVGYSGISLLVGDVFAFSSYGMYTSTAQWDHGAVPLFLANGREDALEKYRDFSGINPRMLHPQGLLCSLEWEVHQARRWFEEHQAGPASAIGPVRVQWGFRVLSWDDDGRLQEEIRIVQEGRAWSR